MVTTVSPVISSSEYNREQQERATESFEANAFRKQASNISVTDEPDPIHTLSGHEPSCRKQDSDFLSLFDGFHKIFSCAPTYFQAQIDTDEETVSTQSEVESIEDTVSEVTPDRAELESIFSAYELEDYGHEQTFVNIINAMFHNVSNSTKVDISGEEEIQVHLLNLKLLSEDLKQSSTYHNTAFIQSLERSIKFIHYEYESDEEKLESMIAELTSPKDFIAFVNRTDGHAIGELIIKNPNVELGEKEYLKISINKGYGGCPNHNYTYQDFTKKELSNILEYPKDGHYHKKLPLLGKDQIVGNCLFIALFEAVKLAASLQTKAFRAQLFNSQNNWFFLPKNNPQTIHAEFKEHSKVDGEPLKLRFPLLYGQHLEQQEDFEGASNLAHLKEVIVKNKRLRNQKTTYYLPTLFREHPDTNFKTIATIVTEGRQNFRQPHNTDSSSQNAEGSPHKSIRPREHNDRIPQACSNGRSELLGQTRSALRYHDIRRFFTRQRDPVCCI